MATTTFPSGGASARPRDAGGPAGLVTRKYHRYMSLDSTVYVLSDEHVALRAAVRELADDKIAPYAGVVDQESRFPQEAHDALVKADLHAIHIPQSYGGTTAERP